MKNFMRATLLSLVAVLGSVPAGASAKSIAALSFAYDNKTDTTYYGYVLGNNAMQRAVRLCRKYASARVRGQCSQQTFWDQPKTFVLVVCTFATTKYPNTRRVLPSAGSGSNVRTITKNIRRGFEQAGGLRVRCNSVHWWNKQGKQIK